LPGGTADAHCQALPPRRMGSTRNSA